MVKNPDFSGLIRSYNGMLKRMELAAKTKWLIAQDRIPRKPRGHDQPDWV